MRRIQIGSSNHYYQFELADSPYLINFDYKELKHLSLNQQSIEPVHLDSHLDFTKTIFKDKSLIGDTPHKLQIKSNKLHEFELTIDHHVLNISAQTITTDSKELSATLLFGPAVIINLALNNTFCFHASSFLYKDNLFLVFAKSGTGKSTIAEYFHTKFKSRIADDIVVAKNIDGKINILPNFPQLKLNTNIQTREPNFSSNIKLIFANKSLDCTNINSLDRFNSTKSIVHHSVATKLFDSTLLHKHLRFCHDFSQQCQAYELKYQHSKNSLDELVNLIDDLC